MCSRLATCYAISSTKLDCMIYHIAEGQYFLSVVMILPICLRLVSAMGLVMASIHPMNAPPSGMASPRSGWRGWPCSQRPKIEFVGRPAS
jgi:hypothetical protein